MVTTLLNAFNQHFIQNISGVSHLIGEFALQVYGVAESKDTKEGIYEANVTWGLLTLFFIWGPASVRVFLLARKKNWREMTHCQRFVQTLRYFLLWLIWPVFTALL